MCGRLVELVTRVLEHELARPFRVPSRERQTTRPFLGQREIPQRRSLGRLVVSDARSRSVLEHRTRLDDPPRPEETVAPGPRGSLHRVGIVGRERELDGLPGQGERLRLALVEPNDRESCKRAGFEQVAPKLLGQRDRALRVRLCSGQALRDSQAERELAVKLQLELRRHVGLAKRLAVMVGSRADVDRVLDFGEQPQRLRAGLAGTRRLDELPRERQGARRRPSRQMISCRLDDAPAAIGVHGSGGGLRRRLAELRCHPRSAAGSRELDRFLQLPGGRGILSLERRRDVACSRDGVVRRDGGQPMRCSTLGDRRFRDRRRREQRMSEPDHAVRALDHLRSDRRSERLLVDSGRVHDLERWGAGHSHDEQRLPRLLRQRAQPLADEVLERVGYRQRLRGIERRPRVERSRQLEREEGIAARCIVQPQQGRTWESESEPVTDETLDRADAERPDGQSLDRSWKRRLERRRRLAAAGEEDPDRLAVEPPQRERERIRRRGIEPLDVVDREQQRAAGGQRDERVVHPDRERARICRDVALGIEQQRRLERPTPWRREHRQHFGGGFPEQVAEPGVRESLLGLGRPRGEHSEPSLARRLRPGQPERRLADARLAFEHEGGGTFRGPPDEVEQGGDLLVSSDDVHPHVGHGDTVHDAISTACGR